MGCVWKSKNTHVQVSGRYSPAHASQLPAVVLILPRNTWHVTHGVLPYRHVKLVILLPQHLFSHLQACSHQHMRLLAKPRLHQAQLLLLRSTSSSCKTLCRCSIS